MRNISIPLIVLVVAFAGSYLLYLTASHAGAQDTAVSINRGSINVQEYFSEKLHEGVIDRVCQPIAVTECLPEQRDVEACIEIYQPVCATIIVQCVTTPCDPVQETFANSCKACANSLVSSYTEGECPVNQ